MANFTPEELQFIVDNPDAFSDEEIARAYGQVNTPENNSIKDDSKGFVPGSPMEMMWDVGERAAGKLLPFAGKLIDITRINRLQPYLEKKMAQGLEGAGVFDKGQLVKEGDRSYGENLNTYLERAGVGDTPALSKAMPFLYSKTGRGFKLKEGGMFDPTARSGVAGATEFVADPINLALYGAGKVGVLGKIADSSAMAAVKSGIKNTAAKMTGTRRAGIDTFLRNPEAVEVFGAGPIGQTLLEHGAEKTMNMIDDQIGILAKMGKTPEIENQILTLQKLKEGISTKGKVAVEKSVPVIEKTPGAVSTTSAEIPDTVPALTAWEKGKHLEGVSVPGARKGIAEASSFSTSSVIDDIFDNVPNSRTPATREAYRVAKEVETELGAVRPETFTTALKTNKYGKPVGDVSKVKYLVGESPEATAAYTEFLQSARSNPQKAYEYAKVLVNRLKEINKSTVKNTLTEYKKSIAELGNVNITAAKNRLREMIDQQKAIVAGPNVSDADKLVLKQLEDAYQKAFVSTTTVKTPPVIKTVEKKISVTEDRQLPNAQKLKSLFERAARPGGVNERAILERFANLPGAGTTLKDLQDMVIAVEDFYKPASLSQSIGMRNLIGGTIGGGLAASMGLPWQLGVLGGYASTSPLALKYGMKGYRATSPYIRPALRAGAMTYPTLKTTQITSGENQPDIFHGPNPYKRK